MNSTALLFFSLALSFSLSLSSTHESLTVLPLSAALPCWARVRSFLFRGRHRFFVSRSLFFSFSPLPLHHSSPLPLPHSRSLSQTSTFIASPSLLASVVCSHTPNSVLHSLSTENNGGFGGAPVPTLHHATARFFYRAALLSLSLFHLRARYTNVHVFSTHAEKSPACGPRAICSAV